MTDTDTAATAKAKKQAVAMRDWVDPAGNPIEAGKEPTATGLRYVHLPTARKLDAAFNPETSSPAADATFAHSFPAVGEPVTPDLLMLGIFGGLTLAGNVVNTATNGAKGDPNINPVPLISERFAELAKGVWSEGGTGGGGVRYDKDKLAEAIATAKGETDASPYLAKMDNKVDPKTGAVVANDTKGAISYGAFALRNGKVKQAYDTITGGGADIGAL